MRAEVVLLNRNINIRASTSDPSTLTGETHGCRVQISDFYDVNVMPGPVMRSGSLNMDYVSLENCSQEDTFKAAIQFEKNALGSSTISNSVVHQGRGHGLRILDSGNINMSNNAIVDFV